MTSLDKIAPISMAPHAPAPGHHLSLELTETLKLAVPLALTQLGQIAMMTTDIAFIGRLGSEAVAAASLAHTVFFVSFTFGMGLVSAVAPLAAQAFGARAPRRPVGGAVDRIADDGAAVSRRADPAGARTGAENLRTCAAISVRPGVGRPAGAVVHRDPRFHECGQPA